MKERHQFRVDINLDTSSSDQPPKYEMKYLSLQLFALVAVLLVSAAAEENKIANYKVTSNAVGETRPQVLSQEYELEAETAEKERPEPQPLEEETDPGVEEQKICLVVRCFPRKWKYQVCVCVKRK